MVSTSSPSKEQNLQNKLVGLGALEELAAGTPVKTGLAVKKAI